MGLNNKLHMNYFSYTIQTILTLKVEVLFKRFMPNELKLDWLRPGVILVHFNVVCTSITCIELWRFAPLYPTH